MSVPRGRILAVAVVLLLMAAGVVALRSGSDASAPTAGPPTADAATASAVDGPPVIVPGRPGEPAVTRPASEVRVPDPPRYNAMDVWFVQMMIPHHEQALAMAALAPDRAGDRAVRAIADRIRAGQGPEVGVLRGWLGSRRLPATVAGHDHGTMRGMQSPEAVRRLAAARGAEFDRLFVAMMTDHHRGAVEMATELTRAGADPTLSDLATSIAVEQNVEIDRMRALLGG